LWHLSCYSSYNPGGVFTSVESPNLGVWWKVEFH
jgi:hypothetical protein